MRRVFSGPRYVLGAVLVLGGIAVSNTGCGVIADTDRIVVATLDGKNITRAELFTLIRDMDDDERPIIRSTRDYTRILNQYIDRKIKLALGQQMAAEGKITIDREQARERFFQSSGDDEEQNRMMWSIPVPEPGEETELMKVYNLGAPEIQAMKNIIEQETDRIVDEMQGDAAVQRLALEAFQAGELTLDPEALRLEYEAQKDHLESFEKLTFLGLQFDASDPNSSTEATRVRERLDSGEPFDAVLEEYLARDIKLGIESEIENNPSVARFQTFWDQASGVKEGDILGPIYMPEYTRARPAENGQIVQEVVPASYLVFRVLEYRPARTLTLEEATPMLAGPIAFAAMMEKLRDQHGVEVYEDKLPEVRGGERDIFES